MHGGERVARVLQAHGVTALFTLCGGHISPILTASRARGLRILDTRHEATAVFAADAMARLTGTPGVAAVTAGPGVTNTMTAIKNASLAQSPVVLLGGAAPTALKGRGALQDIDQRALVEPQVKAFHAVRRVRDLEPALLSAFATAASGTPGPVFVECPLDLLYEEALVRSFHEPAMRPGGSLQRRAVGWYLRRHLDRVFDGAATVAEVVPRPASPPPLATGAVARVRAALSRAERPVMLVGSQATLDASAVARVADAVGRIGIPVYLSGMARGLLGPAHALQRRHRRREALREADCVLLAGVPCDFRLEYGQHVRAGAHLLAVNRNAHDLRLNRRPDIGVLGDPGALLRALADGDGVAAEPRVAAARAEWLSRLQARDMEREAQIDAGAAARGERVNPLHFFRELDVRLEDDSVLVADGGDFVATASYVLRPRRPLSWLDPGVFGTLGVGAGFALGAHCARPGARTWIVFGDGACGFGLAEFDSFVRHGVPVIAVVGNDGGWTQIAREQVKILGDPVGTVLARTRYDEVAAGFGAVGVRIARPEDIGPGLATAIAAADAGHPVLVNVLLDATDFREGSISM